jgi:hypothetical protein
LHIQQGWSPEPHNFTLWGALIIAVLSNPHSIHYVGNSGSSAMVTTIRQGMLWTALVHLAKYLPHLTLPYMLAGGSFYVFNL